MNNVPMFSDWQRKSGCTLSLIRHLQTPQETYVFATRQCIWCSNTNQLYNDLENTTEFLFSSVELDRIYRNLGHAPAISTYSTLRHASQVESGARDLRKLQELLKSCKACQLHSKQPNQYRTILPDQCVFNFEVAIDITIILGQAILHAVCRQTRFFRAAPS